LKEAFMVSRIRIDMTKYTVYSKSKSSGWVPERSFTLKMYAKQYANAITKGTDRKAKVVKRDGI